MGALRAEDLVDKLYTKVELLESRIATMLRGDERSLVPLLDILNQIYDILAELRRVVRSSCS